MPYRALLSDLGGVLHVIPEERFRTTAARFNLTRHDLYQVLYSSLAWRQLEVGNIDLCEYWRRVVLQAPSLAATTHEGLEALLFGDDWGLDRALLAAFAALRPRCRLGILSNHHREMRQELAQRGITTLFDDIVISAEVKVAKPSEAAFRLALALQRLDVLPAEAVFIDDNPENVWVARNLGITSIEHRSTEATLASFQATSPFSPSLDTPRRALHHPAIKPALSLAKSPPF